MSNNAALLPAIDSPADLKSLTLAELNQLAGEIREYLVECVSNTGGHLAPSLGVVELILALHKVYSVPRDKIIWDVGHQTYAHKIITGRREQFKTLRQHGGISGFLRIVESPYDIYGAGHASTSISAALGFAKARDFRNSHENVIAVIGDGALTGGLALEGLNNAAETHTNITIVLNDNEMSIAENVGAMAMYLSRLRMTRGYQQVEKTAKGMMSKLPVGGDIAIKAARGIKHAATHLATPAHTGAFFEEMGLTYLGPIDGHDIKAMTDIFNHVRHLEGPTLVHVVTVKGKGLPYAEANSRAYHGVSKFSPEDGELEAGPAGTSYTAAFSEKLCEVAKNDDKIVAITAAMPDGTGLAKFASEFKERFFDVGIAEQHAVVFAAGLAASGLRPVCAIYSTFLQRAFDPLIHDVALQNLPVRFFIDRAGLVGADGATHNGALDLSYLRCIPNMTILAPADIDEMKAMIVFALRFDSGPIAVRYPRGIGAARQRELAPVELGKSELALSGGTDIGLIALGEGVGLALDAAQILRERGIGCSVINARFCKPLDEEAILSASRIYDKLATVEVNALAGGFGSAVLEFLSSKGVAAHVERFGIPDAFIEHGSASVQRSECGIDPQSIAAKLLASFKLRAFAGV